MSQPESGPTDDRERHLHDILGAYFEAVEAGEPIKPQDLIARHPDHAYELAAFFANEELFERAVGPLQATATTEADPSAQTRTGAYSTDPTGPAPDSEVDSGAPVEADITRGTRVCYFGDYELERVLGQGGMGTVYKAKQLSLNRLVALKMIRAGLWAGEDEVRRFHNEAEAVANLDHPRIVTIHEVGQFEGRHYFSMRLVEGPSLAERLEDYAASPREAARLVSEVARAVHHAHQRGILHRDLKPSNILLDREGRPHVTDFGLAKKLEGDGSLSISGSIVGTPSYMSPEQASGSRQGNTTATDVYGLGALLYAALTGRPPFQSDSVVETLRQVQERAVDRPSQVNRRVDRDLETICLKGLDKDLKRRYGSADALADDLDRYLRGEPILARRTGPAERVVKWAKRKPLVASLVAGLHLVALLSLAGILWQWRQTATANAALDLSNVSLNQTNATLVRNLYDHTIALANSEMARQNVGRTQELLASCPEALRGWEWHYLDGRRFQEPQTLWFPPVIVTDMDFSPDGRLLASAHCQENVARIWDIVTGEELHVLRGHTHAVPSVAFRPDRRQLATASEDLTIKLWDVAAGRELLTLRGHTNGLSCVRYHPDGRRLLSSAWDGTIRVWDANSGQPLQTLGEGIGGAGKGVGGALWLSIHPDGRLVAVNYNGSATARVWDLQTGETIRTFTGVSGSYTSVAFSPDGRRLAIVRESGPETMLVDTATWKIQTTVDASWSPQFSPDSSRLVGMGRSGVKLWAPATGRDILTFPFTRGFTSTFTRDGTTLAIASSSEGRIDLLKALPQGSASDRARILTGHTGPVYSVAFSPDGRWLASTSEDRTARVWDMATFRERLVLKGHEEGLYDVAFDPSRPRIATASKDRTVRIWDAQSGQLLETIGPLASSVNDIAYTSNGERLVIGMGQFLEIWTLHPPERQTSLRSWAVHVEMHPDGRAVAAGGMGEAIYLVDAHTGRTGAFLSGHGFGLWGWNADGSLLAVPVGRHEVRLLDRESLVPRRTLRDPEAEVGDVVISPDGQWMATTSGDGSVAVWDPASGRVVAKLRGHLSSIYNFQFSPDGRWLAAPAGIRGRGEVVLWDMALVDRLEERRRRAASLQAAGAAHALERRWEEAEPVLLQSLGLWRAMASERPADTPLARDWAQAATDLGAMQLQRRSPHQAVGPLTEALAVRRRLAADHPRDDRLKAALATTLQLLGLALGSLGQYPEATRSLREALAILEDVATRRPGDSAPRRDKYFTELYLAAYLAESGAMDEAVTAWERALEDVRKLYDRGNHNELFEPEYLFLIAYQLADRQLAWGQAERARQTLEGIRPTLSDYELAVQRVTESAQTGSDDPFVRFLNMHRSAIWSLMGLCEERLGRREEALASLSKARETLAQLKFAPAGVFNHAVVTLALVQSSRLARLLSTERDISASAEVSAALCNRALAVARDYPGQESVWRNDEYKELYLFNSIILHAPGFAELRSRPEFQAILQDMAFPAWPFAGDPS